MPRLNLKSNYEPKTSGIEYLVRTRNAQARGGTKFLMIPINALDSAIIEARKYKDDNNSIRAAAISLCLDVNELCERLNGVKASDHRVIVSELKTTIAELKEKLSKHE